jgi:hypothetical protein
MCPPSPSTGIVGQAGTSRADHRERRVIALSPDTLGRVAAVSASLENYLPRELLHSLCRIAWLPFPVHPDSQRRSLHQARSFFCLRVSCHRILRSRVQTRHCTERVLPVPRLAPIPRPHLQYLPRRPFVTPASVTLRPNSNKVNVIPLAVACHGRRLHIKSLLVPFRH